MGALVASRLAVDRIKRGFIYLYLGIISAFILAPIIIVVMVSFKETRWLGFPIESYSLKWWTEALVRPEWRDAIWMSVRLALMAMVLSTVAGTLAGLAIHYHDFRGKQFLSLFFLSPLLMPQLLMGLALLFFFASRQMSGSSIALLLGHVLIAFPFVVRLILAALPSVTRSYEEAAMTLGANEFTTLMKITLPLIGPAVRGGALFAFMVSYNNVLISLFLSTPRLVPIPIKILNHLEWTAEPTLAAVSTIFLLITFVLVIVLEITVGLELVPGVKASEA